MGKLMGTVKFPHEEDSGGALTIKVWSKKAGMISPDDAVLMVLRVLEGVITETTVDKDNRKRDPKEFIRKMLDSEVRLEKVLDTTKGMTVRLSNLAMRFYKRDGWSEDALMYYVSESKEYPVVTQDKGEHGEYYIYDVTAKVDKAGIVKIISKVVPGFKEQTTDPVKAVEGYLN